MTLLDTTVAVDYLRGRAEAIEVVESLAGGDEELVASEVVRFELIAGLRPGERGTLERFFGALGWVPVDEIISRAAGDLAHRYRGSHSGIDAPDYFIAATALALEATLLTTNVRHFPMLSGLKAAY